MRNNDTQFKCRAYGKSELAMLYFPNAGTPHTAVNHLSAWIKICDELQEELQKVHYRKTSKFFSPREVALIVEYLGEPGT